MTALAVEFGIGIAGAAIGILGQLLPEDWQKRLCALIGALMVIFALLAAVMELATPLFWEHQDLPAEAVALDRSTPVLQLELDDQPTWTPIPSLTPRGDLGTVMSTPSSTPEETAEPIPSATSAPIESTTRTATTGPTATAATATAEEAETAVATVTEGPTKTPLSTVGEAPGQEAETPQAEATETPKPTRTEEPTFKRLSSRSLGRRSQAVAISDLETREQTDIFVLNGFKRVNVIHSAAWSPDGKRVLIAYRWQVSDYEQGITVKILALDGSGERDVLALPTQGQNRELGNALWAPEGDRIVLFLVDGPNNGVYFLNTDGSGLRRLDHSVPGEWPRYWSVDGNWIVTVDGAGQLHALEADGNRRVPLASLGELPIHDQRYTPWRGRGEPRCDQREDSWWKCR